MKRPTHLNLFTIHLPVVGWASIAHRLAGVMLFLITPFLIYGLETALYSPENFLQIKNSFSTFPGRAILIFTCWAFTHHFLAGLRHLFFDLDIGFSAPFYRWSAILVLAGGVFISLGVGIIL